MKFTRFALSFFAVALIAGVALAQSDTTFTYQGELKQDGSPANGTFNMEFSLWDADVGGTAIGGLLRVVPVVDGKFTAELDFGGAAIDNSARWLQIEVNGVPLSQRTPITRAPYAIQTRGIFVNQDASYVGIGPTADTSNPAVVFGVSRDTNSDFGGMIVETTGGGGFPFYAYTAGGTAGAFHYVDGNTGNWHLVTSDTVQPLLTATSYERVGIGTSIPDAKLSVYEVAAGSDSVALHAIHAGGADETAAIVGEATASGGTGVIGIGSTRAGYFVGDVSVLGTLSKSAGSFKIDHPLDPENKNLSHSFVESPDMMNVYNGNVILDSNGCATITLPDWFQALNREFRYQLTCIGGFSPVYVESEIKDNQFSIAGGKPRMKVSWQVTGIRQDPYAEANRIPVEQMKPAKLRGLYRHPELYGRTPEFSEHSLKLPRSMRGRQKQSTEVSQQLKRDRYGSSGAAK